MGESKTHNRRALSALVTSGTTAFVLLVFSALPVGAAAPSTQRVKAQVTASAVAALPRSGGPATGAPPAAPGQTRVRRFPAIPRSFEYPPARATAGTPSSSDPWELQGTATVRNGRLSSDSCNGPSACTAVGSYQNSSGATVTLAEGWNGTAWSIQATPNPAGATASYFDGVSCSAANACTAVGYSENSSGDVTTLAEAWNGTTWSIQTTLNPSGSDDSMLDAVSCTGASACTAVGSYYSSPGNEVTLAEAWNGSTWKIQTTPNPAGEAYIELQAVSCTGASACSAVGSYYSSPSVIVTVAEAWNGTAWKTQSTVNPAGSDETVLEGVWCGGSSACTAVGFYANSSGGSDTLVETWNGSTWSIQSSPNTADDQSVLEAVSCSSANACTAVGYYYEESGTPYVTLAEAWNGTAWKIQGTPNPAGAASMVSLGGVSCSADDACTAVGYSIKKLTGANLTLIEAWNGTAWKIQKTPKSAGATASELNGMSCSAADACTAVGDSPDSSGSEETLVEAWNGTSWKIQKTPNPTNTFLEGVSCSAADECTAVGNEYISDPLAEAWNGTAWKIQTTPSPAGAIESELDAVSCISASACTAVGFYEDSSGTEVTLSETWNGTAWKIETTPNPAGATGSSLNAVSCSGASACTAVGNYGNSSGVGVTLAEVWNGTAWSIQTTPNATGAIGSSLNAVSCSGASACTAAGDYGSSSGYEVTLAEAWNGTAWKIETTPNPTGATGSYLYGESCSGAGACTAVGWYFNSSDVELTLAEAWNGTAWSIQTTPNPAGSTDSQLDGVSCSAASACEAVGFYDDVSGIDLTLAEVENG